MGFGPKVKAPIAPPPPPPPPTAPDYSSAIANKRARPGMQGALGGTFLTQGMQLGSAKRGKSLLGV